MRRKQSQRQIRLCGNWHENPIKARVPLRKVKITADHMLLLLRLYYSLYSSPIVKEPPLKKISIF